MTTVCGGGASGPQAGFNETVVITSAAVEAGLTLIGLEPVALLLAPFIAGETYDLTTFCLVDPPADPGLTAGDLIDVTNFIDPTVSIPAINKVRQWFKSWYWYQVCKCTSTTTPAPPALSNPGGYTQNPSLPSQGNGFCFQGTASVSGSQTTVPGPTDVTGALAPTNGAPITGVDGVFGSGFFNVLAYPIPPTMNRIDLYYTSVAYDPAISAGQRITAAFNFFLSDGTWLSGLGAGQAGPPAPENSNTVIRGDSSWNSSATHFSIAVGNPGYGNSPHSTVKQTLALRSQVTCAGSALQSECCPPDPTIELKLNQIIGMLTALFGTAPAPFSGYATATVHSGLSGNGTLTLDDSPIAVKVAITTDIATGGIDSGSPDYLFDRGYVVPIISAGPVRAEARLVYNPQVFLMPALVEQLGYSLAPGLVVTVTELVPA